MAEFLTGAFLVVCCFLLPAFGWRAAGRKKLSVLPAAALCLAGSAALYGIWAGLLFSRGIYPGLWLFVVCGLSAYGILTGEWEALAARFFPSKFPAPRFCRYCGSAVGEKARFCRCCGRRLR